MLAGAGKRHIPLWGDSERADRQMCPLSGLELALSSAKGSGGILHLGAPLAG